MTQDPEEIEKSYEKLDPWGYQSNPEDLKRKQIILARLLERYPRFDRALDLGCGEGWITQDLPSRYRYGYELSKTARTRFRNGVIVDEIPNGKYDLVVATGVLYDHYDFKLFFHLMQQHSSSVMLTCNIKAWERKEMSDPSFIKSYFNAEEVYSEEFPYREFTQKLRIFEKI